MCGEGYYCVNGSINARGEVGVLGGVGNVCPPGYICPVGTSEPIPCSNGTYNPYEMQSDSSSCLPCPARRFCPDAGMTEPQGDCEGGFYCVTSESSSNPNICPEGHFCPNATAFPHLCVDGTYQDEPGSSSCDPCPAGMYCTTNKTHPEICPAGSYCPEGYGFPIFCSDGTYSTTAGLTSQSECLPCPSGRFCTNGLIREKACHAGFVCYRSSWTPVPRAPSVPLSIGEKFIAIAMI